MKDEIYTQEIFLILYSWNERNLDQIQTYIDENLLDILAKLDVLVNHNLIYVLKEGSSINPPIYSTREENINQKMKNLVENNIEILIKKELNELTSIYETDVKSAFRSLSFLEKKWNIFKLKDQLPYYLDLKQKINFKIKKEINF